MAAGADGARGQRPLVCDIHAAATRPSRLCDRSLDRRVCDLATWCRTQAESRPGSVARRPGRRGPAHQSADRRSGGAAADPAALRRISTDRRYHAAAVAGPARRHGEQPGAARPHPDRTAAADDRPAARPLRRLVRDGAAQPEHRAWPPWHLPRLHRAAAGCRRDGLRRGVLHPDPSDRPHQPQGPQQRAEGRAR